MQQPELEQIPGGEWSAGAVAQCSPDLYDEVVDVFTGLDPRANTRDVLDYTEGSKPKLARVLLLDDWFGEIADPYADEDDV